jgi:hypothetical protein
VSEAPLEARVLVDTGPLVALLRRNDIHHRVCTQTLRTIRPPLWTCWPVLTEAAWLLRDLPRALDRLYAGPRTGVYRVLPLPEESLESIAEMARKFRSLRPQLTDLALVHLAEREGIGAIFTLDRRDFSVLRTKRGKPFRLLPELL